MKKLNIIYEDKYLIVVYKPSGMLTIAKDNKYSINLYDEVKEYLKRKNPKNKVFIVHRLDRETSGIIVFAKSEYVKVALQNNWQDVIRDYYAVVGGSINKDGHLEDYLTEDKNLFVHVNKFNKGNKAITDYKVIRSNKKYSVLDINIKTGRKNQIRVQFANINHPIVGDLKYGDIKASKMCLQAYHLKFRHPVLKKDIDLCVDMDKYFEKY